MQECTREGGRVRRAGWVACGIALAGFAIGCESGAPLPGATLLEGVEAGAAKEAVLAVLPDGGLRPTQPMEEAQFLHGYGRDRYFIAGEFIEVLWLHDPAAGTPVGEGREVLNPVIFRDDVLDGWGWAHFDTRRELWALTERSPAAAAGVMESLEAAPEEAMPEGAEEGDGDGSETEPSEPEADGGALGPGPATNA